VLQLVAQAVGLLLAGVALARLYPKPVDILNKLLFYGTLPLALTVSVVRIADLIAFSLAFGAALIHMAATMGAAIALAKLARLESGRELVTLSSLPNALFIGFPLAAALLGDSKYAVPHAVAFNAILVLLLAYLGSRGPRRVRAAVALYAASFIAGLVLNLAGAYRVAASFLDTLASIISTVNMLSFVVVGASLYPLRVSRSTSRSIALVAAFRYLASPLMLLAALSAFSFLGLTLDSGFVAGSFLQSIMPPAVTCIVIGRELRMDESLIAAAIVTLTPASVILAVLLQGVGAIPGSFG